MTAIKRQMESIFVIYAFYTIWRPPSPSLTIEDLQDEHHITKSFGSVYTARLTAAEKKNVDNNTTPAHTKEKRVHDYLSVNNAPKEKIVFPLGNLVFLAIPNDSQHAR